MKIARWVVLAPAAFLAYLAAYVIARMIQRLSMAAVPFWDADATIPKLFIAASASLVAGASFVVAASAVAPSHKREAALVLSGFLSACFLFILFRTSSSDFAVSATETAFTIFGLFAGFDSVRSQLRVTNSPDGNV